MKLSQAQRDAMFALSMADGWRNPYELGAGMNTLNALVSKGLAKRRTVEGAILLPRFFKLYAITFEGRAWAEEHINKPLREMVE